MASTWGNNTWGSNEWQDDVILITPTGFSTTASVGTVEAFNTKGWGRDDFGNGAWGVEYSVALSGQQADTTLGTVVQGIGVPLEMIPNPPTGDQLLKIMRGQVGEISIGIGAELTGVQSDFATPTLSYAGTLVGWGRDGWNDNSWGESPDQVIPAVGLAATASVGDITPADVVGVSGQESTTALGSATLQIDSTPDITGQAATSNLGTLGLEFGPAAISGVSASFNVGTLGLEFGPADITGILSTASVGELTIDDAQIIDVTGVSATSAIGSVTVDDMSVGLSGQAGTSAVGSPDIDDISIGLILDELTSNLGILGIQHYANIDSGSNTSYSDRTTGSNTSYSDEATGSNTSYSNKTTGSNGSYSNVATGSNTSYTDAA